MMTTKPPACANAARSSELLQGQLNSFEQAEFESHLESCAACRQWLEDQAADEAQWREASHLLMADPYRSSLDARREHETTGSHLIEQVITALAPTDDPEMLGRIGSYEVSGVIGVGGMGVVLKAHDRSLDRIVAVKVMAPHLASSGSARKRFERESKAAAAVLHPNVIAIHSVNIDGALPYLVMPYVRGQSLQKRIDAEGPLPQLDILRIGAQIASGLAAAHNLGLVHRDIKPANILLEDGVERVAITDFGLARAVDDASLTRSGVIAGTPQYMSPEQSRGEPIDHRSDLFSLGSVLYAMCSGHSPFRAETSYGVLHRIGNEAPRTVRDINTDVPEWFDRLIHRLLSKNPADRIQSAHELVQLLSACIAHLEQPSTHSLPSALRETKSRRRSWLAAVTAAVLLLVGFGVMTSRSLTTVSDKDEGSVTSELPDDRSAVGSEYRHSDHATQWDALPITTTLEIQRVATELEEEARTPFAAVDSR
ncbi:MAG: serine/threonine protein kinase [Planctomycetales bacterium]|nr:serine/threonine protein kinase [Planctomycetales bacterium]